MRDYEITIIIQPKLEEQGRTELVEQVSTWLIGEEASEENKLAVNHWGMRRLAYPIDKHVEGYYVLYEGQVDPTRLADVERNFQYNEDLIRYLIVRKES
ncbi:MAG: 30S ribosomal protein S6 [Chloroflexi bacterium]|nr:30S ribosomal protein S6 [Chloroflexota bacterium]